MRQKPGADNPLGQVKFMFPNAHSVYLHDTPSKALFEQSERAFSSGCIRIENPLELATLLLEGQKGWDRAAIDRAVETGATQILLPAMGEGEPESVARLALLRTIDDFGPAGLWRESCCPPRSRS